MKPKIVCIDPGHGGTDPGALGPAGPIRLQEKDVTLAVALKLEALLKDRVDVVMTRRTDVFVSLSDRCAIANAAKADVFLSIHCNSAEASAQGIETFIATATKTAEPLGTQIQDSMVRAFPVRVNRGLKRASFAVLNGTQMPAALAELEFIHTTAGEKLLKDPQNQFRYASALADGVLRFLAIRFPVESLASALEDGVKFPPIQFPAESLPSTPSIPRPTPEALGTGIKTVTEAQIDALLDESETQEHTFWGKEMLVSYKLKCGWSVTGRSACVDSANFNPELGRKFAREDAKRQLWMLEGYRLQWA